MAGLTEFLTARLDEDEAKAQAVRGSYPSYPWGLEEAELALMERWTPERVLLDIAAKRAALETCVYYLHEYESGIDPCANLVMHALVQPYRWHPEFREEWADE